MAAYSFDDGDMVFHWEDTEPCVSVVQRIHRNFLVSRLPSGKLKQIQRGRVLPVKYIMDRVRGLTANMDMKPVTTSYGNTYLDAFGNPVHYNEPVIVRYSQSIPRLIRITGNGPKGGMKATIDTRFPSRVVDNGFALNPRVIAVAIGQIENEEALLGAILYREIIRK